MKTIASFILLALAASQVQGTVYTACSLAQDLYYNYGVTDMDTLANWVCTAQYESSWNDQAVGPVNYNGSQDYGLFQINDQYWCQGAISSSNSCGIACTSLLGNLAASFQCAQMIQQQSGFTAWYGWQKGCANGAPSVASCF